MDRQTTRERRREYYLANREYLLWQSAENRRKAQELSRKGASRNGLPWTPEDDSLVMSQEFTDLEISDLLGRTYGAVRARRQRLRKQG
jgi:hypothetical protein